MIVGRKVSEVVMIHIPWGIWPFLYPKFSQVTPISKAVMTKIPTIVLIPSVTPAETYCYSRHAYSQQSYEITECCIPHPVFSPYS